MNRRMPALGAAFFQTIPIMTGYLFLGAAFGVLLQSKGYSWPWALWMSAFIYAGSMQFAAVGLMAGAASAVSAALLTLMVNGRHLFYGLSMLEQFRNMGRKRPYMIFSLTDETFSLLCSAKAPAGVDPKQFGFFISLLDQLYWVAGSVAGAAAGALLPFDSKGIDFVMTALFTVIFLDRWKAEENHRPALLGVAIALICLLVFGKSVFLLPSLFLTTAVFLAFRRKLAGEGKPDEP